MIQMESKPILAPFDGNARRIHRVCVCVCVGTYIRIKGKQNERKAPTMKVGHYSEWWWCWWCVYMYMWMLYENQKERERECVYEWRVFGETRVSQCRTTAHYCQLKVARSVTSIRLPATFCHPFATAFKVGFFPSWRRQNRNIIIIIIIIKMCAKTIEHHHHHHHIPVQFTHTHSFIIDMKRIGGRPRPGTTMNDDEQLWWVAPTLQWMDSVNKLQTIYLH